MFIHQFNVYAFEWDKENLLLLFGHLVVSIHRYTCICGMVCHFSFLLVLKVLLEYSNSIYMQFSGLELSAAGL